MKTIALMAFMMAGVIGSAIVLLKLSTALAAAEQPHPFKNLNAPPLWTSEPVRIDPDATPLPRLPPEYSTYALAQPASVEPKTAVASADTGAAAQQKPAVSAEHVAWCSARYKSFNPATNSYRAFDGDIRSCAGAGDDATRPAPSATASLQADGANWCADRYKSYRTSDNTYQPLGGGPRRTCALPRVVADASILQ